MKQLSPKKQIANNNQEDKRLPYETPAIIYEGIISTRAGSPAFAPDAGSDGADPSDLFGK